MSLTDQEKAKIVEEEKLRAKTAAQEKSKQKTKGCLGCLGVLVILFVIGSVIGGNNNSSPNTTTDAPQRPTNSPPTLMSGPEFTFQHVNNYFVSHDSTATDIQKEKLWKEKYDGRRVQWAGEVTEVGKTFGKTQIHIRHLDSTLSSDVLLTIRSGLEDQAAQLQKGQQISYQGNLSSYGSFIGLSLVDGTIQP